MATFYVLCDDDCRYESMTKEQILSAIQQGLEQGYVSDPENAVFSKIKEVRAGAPAQVWIGTEAEFNAISPAPTVGKSVVRMGADGTMYVCTDDTTLADVYLEMGNIDVNIADTGWVPLALGSGVSAGKIGDIATEHPLEYRLVNGNHMYIRGNVAVEFKSSTTINADLLPEAYRPQETIYRLNTVGGRLIMRNYVHTDGRIQIEWVQNIASSSNTSGVDITWCDIWIEYFLD